MHDVPVDPALPALRDLLSPEGAPDLAAELAERCGARVHAEAARVSYVRYRPTRGCDVLWTFPAANGQPVWVAGKMAADAARFTASSSFQRSAEKVKEARGIESAPYVLLADRRLLLQIFPLDARLPGLALAADSRWSGEAVRQRLALSEDEWRLTEVVPLHYKPGRRCVLRYAVDRRGRPARYFGKVFRDDRGAPMVERLRAVRSQLLASHAHWDVAVPAAYVPEASMLVLEGLEACDELSPLVRKSVSDPKARETLRAYIVGAAEGLRAFQKLAVEGLESVGPRDVLSQYDAEFEGIRHVAPSLADAIRVQLQALDEAALRLPREDLVVGHGAFRYNQFLVREDTLIVLDLDALRMAGRGADAGEFLAYFDLVALRRPHLRPAVRECQQVFLGAILQHPHVDPRWLAWHRAASLVKWTHRTFLSLDTRWPELTERLLRLAEHALGDSPACTGVPESC